MFGKNIAVKTTEYFIDWHFTEKRPISELSTQHPFFNALARGKLRLLMLKLTTTLSPYTMRQGKVWAVICHPGKPFITIDLKECDN